MRELAFSTWNSFRNSASVPKACTIRLGDQTRKYADGDVVLIAVGKHYTNKRRQFPAYIDKVMLKKFSQLTLEELHSENADFSNIDDLKKTFIDNHGNVVPDDALVTVVYYSEIIE